MKVFGGRSEYPQTIIKLSFGTSEMEAYANECFVRLFVAKKIKKINKKNK